MKKIQFIILGFIVMSIMYYYNLSANEISSGAGSSYPTGIDTDYDKESSTKIAKSATPNDLADAVVKIETALGTAPAGGYTNVRKRFEALDASTASTQTFCIGDGDIYLSSNTFLGNGEISLPAQNIIIDKIYFYTTNVSTVTAGTMPFSCSFNIAWSSNTTSLETNYNYLITSSGTVFANNIYSSAYTPIKTSFVDGNFYKFTFHTLGINGAGALPAGYGCIIVYTKQ